MSCMLGLFRITSRSSSVVRSISKKARRPKKPVPRHFGQLMVRPAALGYTEVGQRVGAFVADAVVSSDPVPVDVVAACGIVQQKPEVAVVDGLLVRYFPAALLPVVNPLGNALAGVLAIGEQLDLAGTFQSVAGLDHRG